MAATAYSIVRGIASTRPIDGRVIVVRMESIGHTLANCRRARVR
jgi:hypothetical protein